MTEEEILEKLKEADRFLEAYKKAVLPVAEELARQKSIAVYGKEGCYNGELGCYESGCDAVCLHIKEMGENWEADQPFHEKAIDWEMAWSRKAHESGIKHIYITGHF